MVGTLVVLGLFLATLAAGALLYTCVERPLVRRWNRPRRGRPPGGRRPGLTGGISQTTHIFVQLRDLTQPLWVPRVTSSNAHSTLLPEPLWPSGRHERWRGTGRVAEGGLARTMGSPRATGRLG